MEMTLLSAVKTLDEIRTKANLIVGHLERKKKKQNKKGEESICSFTMKQSIDFKILYSRQICNCKDFSAVSTVAAALRNNRKCKNVSRKAKCEQILMTVSGNILNWVNLHNNKRKNNKNPPEEIFVKTRKLQLARRSVFLPLSQQVVVFGDLILASFSLSLYISGAGGMWKVSLPISFPFSPFSVSLYVCMCLQKTIG